MPALDLVLALIALFFLMVLTSERLFGAMPSQDRRSRIQGEDGNQFAKPSAQHSAIEIGGSNGTIAREQSDSSPQKWPGNDESDRQPVIGSRTA